MKLIITENNKQYAIPLPLSLLTILPIFNKENLPKAILKEIVRSLRDYKKEFGSFTLLEVEESDAQTVKIII